jgi:hypothetical protein
MTSEDKEDIRHCAGCDITDTEAVLFDIILPPLIKHCPYPCELKVELNPRRN